MKNSRTANSVRNIGFGYAQQIITMILAFATRTVFVRLLGAEYTGVNGLFTNILTLLSLAELGVGNVLTYSLYGALKENNEEKISQLISYYKKLYRYIAFAVTVIGVVLIPFLGLLVNSELPLNEIRVYYVLYLVNSIVSYFVVYKVTLLRADQKEYVKNIAATVSLVLQYIFQIVYLLIFKNFIGYLLIQIFFTIAQNVACNFVANKQYPFLKNKNNRTDLIDKKGLFDNVKSMFVYKVSNVVVTSTDNILISVLIGTVYVGYYSNYSMIVNYVSTFINLTITAITGSLGNLNAENDKGHSYQIFREFMYLFSTVAVFCSMCLATVSQDFVRLWVGDEYVIDYATLLVIIATFYVTHAFDPTWMFCETMGLFKERKSAMVVNAVLNIGLSIILSRYFGMTGILGATAIARLLTIVWWEPHILFKLKFQRSIMEYVKQVAKLTLIGVIAFGLSIAICNLMPGSFVFLIIKVVVCAVILFILELVFMRNTGEFKWVKEKVLQVLKVKAK